jgi:hypothetical protein
MLNNARKAKNMAANVSLVEDVLSEKAKILFSIFSGIYFGATLKTKDNS